MQRTSKHSHLIFPYASPALPPEIVDLIVQDENFCVQDFYNLSLVSYVWKEPSQRRLFSTINLDPGKDHPLFNISPNSDDVRVLRYIKHLTIFSTSTTSWIPFPCDTDEDIQFQFENDPKSEVVSDDHFHHSNFTGVRLGATRIHMVPDPEASGPPHAKFPLFLLQLSKLESFTVRDRLNWYLLSEDVVKGYIHILGLESFRSLNIWRGSATRLPFIFLHFCFNLKHLSLNVWPTTLLEPIGINEADLLVLKDMPAVRPSVLKLTGASVVDSLNHYVRRAQPPLGNSISLDHLRALYIAYDEDPSCATTGSIWHSKRVGRFLSAFGKPLEELVLEVDHRSYTSRAASPISAKHISQLTNLRDLRVIIHNGTLQELDFNEAFTWLLPLLKNLPKPSKLQTFQLLYSSSSRWTEDFEDLARTGEDFFDELFGLLNSTFTGLKAVRTQMKLFSVNGVSGGAPPVCHMVDRCDYAGLVKLKAKGVNTVLQVAVKAVYDESFP